VNAPPRPPVAVVTGATSGIGAAVARGLVTRGFEVEVVSRHEDRCRAVVAELTARGGRAQHVAADLSTAAGCATVIGAIRARHPSLQLLINNAGAIYPSYAETGEGHERTFALNVLAPYRLSVGLGPVLAADGPARVINVASAAHRGQHLRPDDLEGRAGWGSYRSYGRSKLSLILLTAAMARRSDPLSVAFFSVHPGLVRTRWGAAARPSMRAMIRFGWLVAISPEKAARTVLYAALSPDLAGRSGLYLARERVVDPSRAARDVSMADVLWEHLQRSSPQ
jgi:retinol dehydrogenase-12